MPFIETTPDYHIRREPYLEYEFQADLGGALVLLNDAAETFDHLAAVKVGDKILRFKLKDANPTETILFNDNICYPNVFEGVDLYYTTEPGRLKEYFLINGSTNRHSVTFVLEQEGVTASLQDDNSIVYRDEAGEIVWVIDAPYATDSSQNIVPVTMSYDGLSYTVTAVPNENTKYPICLDPTVTVTGSIAAWLQALTTATVNLGPKRYEIGRLGYTGLISKVEIYCIRTWQDVVTTVSTNVIDNSSPYTKTWYQFYSKNNVALAPKADLVVSTNKRGLIDVPVDAYYIELTGQVAGVDPTFKGYNFTYIAGYYYDDTKSDQWSMQAFNFPNSNTITTFKSHLKGIPPSDNNKPFVKTVHSYPGTYFSTSTTMTVTYTKDANGAFTLATIKAYATDGTVLLSKDIDVSATGKTTSFLPPANTSYVSLEGTFQSLSSLYSGSSLSVTTVLIAYTPESNIYMFQAKRNYVNARFAPDFLIKPVVTPKYYVSLNNQSSYVEGNKITANIGDMVYVRVARQPGDSATTTINTNCVVMIPEYLDALFNGDLKRKVAAANILSCDSNRKSLQSISISNDTKRKTLLNIITNSDTLRSVVKRIDAVIQSDAVRRIVAPLTTATDMVRRINKAVSNTYDSKRTLRTSIVNYYNTKRRLTMVTWEYIKNFLLNITIDELPTEEASLNQSLSTSVIIAPSSTELQPTPTGGAPQMLIQGTHAVINVNVLLDIDTPYNLEDCSLSMLLITPDTKTVLSVPLAILNIVEGTACAYLTPELLPEGGTYQYQVCVTFPDDTVSKSAISAFYVADSINLPAPTEGDHNG